MFASLPLSTVLLCSFLFDFQPIFTIFSQNFPIFQAKMSLCRRRRDPIADTIYTLSPFKRICVILFGAVSIHLTIGTYHTFGIKISGIFSFETNNRFSGNMLPYMASYMRNFTDPSVRIEHMMWIPTFQGCFPFAMVIGGLTSSTFSPRVSAFIGCALVTWV